jgi:hypothetical protein
MKTWPNLELRARIVRQHNAAQHRARLVNHVIAAVMPNIVASVDPPLQDDSIIDVFECIEDDADLDEAAVHVKDCTNCKARLARAARNGAYIPEQLLIAAGIDILRN